MIVAAAALLCLLAARPAGAATVLPLPRQLLPETAFPSARDYYEPLTADPTELGYGGRLIYPVGGDRFGEITLGDYVGVFRWRLGEDWGAQLNLGGGAIGRFNLSTERNNLEVVDFSGAMPLDINYKGAHTLRTGFWHTSSHLGDDYIARIHPPQIKRAMDLLKSFYSFTPDERLRLYVGGSFAFNAVNIAGRSILQAGAEVFSRRFWSQKAQWFLAQDLQTHERVGWNASYNIRGGLRLADSKRIAAASLFLEYFTGHNYYLQFYEAHENHWGFGLKFEIGNPTR